MGNYWRRLFLPALGLVGLASLIWSMRSVPWLNVAMVELSRAVMQAGQETAQFPAYVFQPSQLSVTDARIAARAACEATSNWDNQSAHGHFCRALLDILDSKPASARSTLQVLRDHGYRPFIIAFLYGLSVYQSGFPEQAYALWRGCPLSACELLFERLHSVEGCQIAVAISPGSSDAHFCLGRALSDHGRYLEAIEAFKQALELDRPLEVQSISASRFEVYSRAEALYRIGETWLTLGELAKAEPYLDQAISLNPTHYWAPLQKAVIEKQLHSRPDRAITLLLALTERYPDHASAMLHLGWTYEERADLANAAMWFEQATRALPTYARAHVELARVRARLGNWSASLVVALRAIDLDPSLVEAYYWAGQGLYAEGQLTSAVTYALRAAEMQPSNVEFLTLVGDIYERLGNESESAVWRQRALDADLQLNRGLDNDEH